MVNLNKMIMKKLLIILALLLPMGVLAQGPEFLAPGLVPLSPQPNFDGLRTHQLREADIHRNSNIIILMVNENQIRHFNHWRIWHKLKERKRYRIVRRWQKIHDRNNIKPEFLRREHR